DVGGVVEVVTRCCDVQRPQVASTEGACAHVQGGQLDGLDVPTRFVVGAHLPGTPQGHPDVAVAVDGEAVGKAVFSVDGGEGASVGGFSVDQIDGVDAPGEAVDVVGAGLIRAD